MARRNLLAALICTLFLAGCSTISSQISGRTATEQYLVTEAIQRAIDNVRWSRLSGQRIKLEIVGVQETEHKFIRSALEKELASHGSRVVDTTRQADVRMTAMVRAVGTDIWVSNFGIPLLVTAHPEVPSNVGGISLYNSNLQEGYCRMDFFGTHPLTDQVLWRIPVVHGDSYFKTTTFLGLFGPYKSSDIFPERKLIRPKGYVPIPRKGEE
ncbi:MAG: hypothetical protein KJ050_03530 [Candidatus Omnitrophica bacterium]|nr:MAG: hypothetical protein UZ16_OP3001000976 [Candidatus Hinthialibacteria bacterium OLB16]MBE7489735.1 hypothetical protein [bacterium]MCC6732700.1 hypothetical protein [Candidatus Omnitrophota bacterium]MCE7909166.1 hypothetical protein [Candidatus Omnitrophica bacterium COP1]MBV6481856.1 hypothetical protein [bacterium]